MLATGFNAAVDADFGEEGLHANLHSVLHAQRGDARGGPVVTVRRRVVQGLATNAIKFFSNTLW